ncbi:MAG: hypothetical protein IT359_20760 [Gemmatimonadaceae bacterium]|nr:hypothetical protein [Gemmatimonadaceae bacterium]
MLLTTMLTLACGGEPRAPVADSALAAPLTTPAASDTGASPSTAGETSALPHGPADEAGEFRLAGNEPFWGVRISKAGLRYTTPDYKDGILFPATAPQTDGATLRWIALTAAPDAHTLEVRLETRRCQDSMADKAWTHIATVVFDGATLKGCGERVSR